jgi:hypothetical protein
MVPKIHHLKYTIWNTPFGIHHLEYTIWNTPFGIHHLEYPIWKEKRNAAIHCPAKKGTHFLPGLNPGAIEQVNGIMPLRYTRPKCMEVVRAACAG